MPRYCGFFRFSGRRLLNFFRVQRLNLPSFIEICQIVVISAQIMRFSFFSNAAAIRHLGFFTRVFGFGVPGSSTSWSSSFWIFDRHRYSTFTIIIFRVWLENAYSCHKIVLGDFTPPPSERRVVTMRPHRWRHRPIPHCVVRTNDVSWLQRPKVDEVMNFVT